jgi:hypothetical protein
VAVARPGGADGAASASSIGCETAFARLISRPHTYAYMKHSAAIAPPIARAIARSLDIIVGR